MERESIAIKCLDDAKISRRRSKKSKMYLNVNYTAIPLIVTVLFLCSGIPPEAAAPSGVS